MSVSGYRLTKKISVGEVQVSADIRGVTSRRLSDEEGEMDGPRL